MVAGRGADQQPAVGVQPDDRRQDRLAVLIQDFRLAVADDGHLAVGGAQVDAENGFHGRVQGSGFGFRKNKQNVRPKTEDRGLGSWVFVIGH